MHLHNTTRLAYSYAHSKYYPHAGNSSITTSVTIVVTPAQYHLVSWGVLWGGFLLGIILASYQVRLENLWFASRRRDIEQQGQSDGEAVSSADWTRSRVSKVKKNKTEKKKPPTTVW
jgi:hypothetical protein